MEDLIKEVQEQVLAKAKKENRSDFENLFKEVMNHRLSFYTAFEEHKGANIKTLKYSLDKN